MKAIAITIRATTNHGVGSKGLRGGRGKNSSWGFIFIYPGQLSFASFLTTIEVLLIIKRMSSIILFIFNNLIDNTFRSFYAIAYLCTVADRL